MVTEIPPLPDQPAPTVDEVVGWSLDHLTAHRAVLVGVEPGLDAAGFHVVPLSPEDPIADVASLAIPASWEILVVVLDHALVGGDSNARLAVGVDRRRPSDDRGASPGRAGVSMSRRGGRCRTPAPPTRPDPR